MKVLLANSGKLMRGGEFQTIALAEGLLHGGCEVMIVAREGAALAGKAGALLRCETVPFESVPIFTPIALARLIARWRPDILHAQTSDAHTHLWLARRLLGDAPPLVVSRRVAFPIRKGLFSRLKYGTGVERYIPISSAAAASLSARGVSASRMTIVPSGVDVGRFKEGEGSREVAERWGISEGDFVIGVVAALEQEKGHAILVRSAVEVVRECPRARFLFVGEGTLRGYLENEISRLALAGKVRCERQDAPLEEIIPLFDIFVLPSLSEGLSTALIAAMAAGIAVVASHTGGIPEVLTPECGVLVPPGDADALSRAIIRLARDEDMRRRMSAAGARRAELFDIAATVRRTREIYDLVLGDTEHRSKARFFR